MQQAVWLDWSNYWYQFYLAYLEEEGLPTTRWSTIARRWPASRTRPGCGSAAPVSTGPRDAGPGPSMIYSRPETDGKPTRIPAGRPRDRCSAPVSREFCEAANEYKEIIAAAPNSVYACAARLNLANIDAESGREEQRRATYESLLKTHPEDRPARLSRAILCLRQGQPEAALTDLNVLLGPEVKIADRDEVLATRAIALLLSKQAAEAVADAALSSGSGLARRTSGCCNGPCWPPADSTSYDSTARTRSCSRRRPVRG